MEAEVKPGSKGFILVVDDVAHNLQVLCNILGKQQYKLAVARSGQQALDMMEKISPDLVLLDVMMPEIDGFEVCRRLSGSPRTRHIPIIFLTAKTDTESVIRGFETGAVDYVTKPFNSAELLARVNTHLELKYTREELIGKNKELTRAKKRLEAAARTDPLTLLSNRREILENIERERIRYERSGRTFTLLLGDLDNFKQFNDRYGHDCGDFLLVQVAKIMKSLVRKQDSVARWGGEEFLLLLPETNLEGGYTTAEKIKSAISGPSFIYNGISLNVSITFGVSMFGCTCTPEVDDCIKTVDMAMYEGKQQGKNCVIKAKEINIQKKEEI